MTLKPLGPKGEALIKKAEALALKAYKKGNDVPTIGWGHTLNVRLGDTCTEAQAQQWFDEDTAVARIAVANAVIVPLNQNQFDALVSFAFNLGGKSLRTSTLLRLLNSGEYEGTAAEFNKWVYSHGVKLNGLVTRRAAESALFSEAVA